MVYPALLPLMRTLRLPVVDSTDAPADLNGLVRFAERRNLVSARVPSHFKRSLKLETCPEINLCSVVLWPALKNEKFYTCVYGKILRWSQVLLFNGEF